MKKYKAARFFAVLVSCYNYNLSWQAKIERRLKAMEEKRRNDAAMVIQA